MPPVQTRLPPSTPPTSSPTSSRPRSGIMPVHAPYPTASASASSSAPSPYVRPSAPYMVALSGWPEPVYISNRSRPSTPRPSFPGEQGDGVVLPSPTSGPHGSRSHKSDRQGTEPRSRSASTTPGVPAESIFSKTCMYNPHQEDPCPIPDHPNHVEKYSAARNAALSDRKHKHERERERERDHDRAHAATSSSATSFPTSSTRTPTHSPPLRPTHIMPHYNATPSSRYGTFRDPRMAPNVGVLSNRAALPIAPGWTSSASASTSAPTSSPSPQHAVAQSPGAVALPNVGMKVPAGERGTGILVLRAVPDVYPPPMSHAMAGLPGMAGIAADMARTGSRQQPGHGHAQSPRGVGVATEVYPRDPDSAFLWGSAAGVGRKAEEQTEERMDVDERHW